MENPRADDTKTRCGDESEVANRNELQFNPVSAQNTRGRVSSRPSRRLAVVLSRHRYLLGLRYTKVPLARVSLQLGHKRRVTAQKSLIEVSR